MKNWKILNKFKKQKTNFRPDDLIKLLLENRGIKTKKDIEEFLNPKLENVTTASVGIDRSQLEKTLKRIKIAIENKEQMIVFGDYDVDGITGTAILWETLYELGANVLPYIPDRIEEGYGLSIAGIKNLIKEIPRLPSDKSRVARDDKVRLIITVDNGIVANEAVDFANKNGIDVIVTDHHTLGEKLPEAYAIVHTTKLCGAGIAYLLSQELKTKNEELKTKEDSHLELAALGTVADMVPLHGANRTIVKLGLGKLSKTKRPGLLELFKQAGIDPIKTGGLGIYEVGFMIAPRLNAAGRIASALDSLRLLCTKSIQKARVLAEKLELTNRERQLMMKEATEDAILRIKNKESRIKEILIIGHENYNQGVIGLVAGKLVEEFYRPSIVLSIGEKQSKASARSISGFNIIEFLRTKSEFFVNVGGHPMAAGFTIETAKLVEFTAAVESAVEKLIDENTLTKTLSVDCELPMDVIDDSLYSAIQQLAPFGMKNPEPVFATKNVIVEDVRVLGKEGKHLKLEVKSQKSKVKMECIAFGMGELAGEIKVGDRVDAAYNVDENVWNGNKKLQLKVRDIKLNST